MNISVKQIIGLVAVYQIYKHRKGIKVVADYAGSVIGEVVAGAPERVGRRVADDVTNAIFDGRLDDRMEKSRERRAARLARHENESADIDDSYDAWRASRHAARRNA